MIHQLRQSIPQSHPPQREPLPVATINKEATVIQSPGTAHQPAPAQVWGCLLSITSVGVTSVQEHHPSTHVGPAVERFASSVITGCSQYSRSEVVLTFFERSPLDQVLKNDNVHKIQPSFQSPVKISGKSLAGGLGGLW